MGRSGLVYESSSLFVSQVRDEGLTRQTYRPRVTLLPLDFCSRSAIQTMPGWHGYDSVECMPIGLFDEPVYSMITTIVSRIDIIMFSRGVILRDRCETRWSKHSVKGGDGGLDRS